MRRVSVISSLYGGLTNPQPNQREEALAFPIGIEFLSLSLMASNGFPSALVLHQHHQHHHQHRHHHHKSERRGLPNIEPDSILGFPHSNLHLKLPPLQMLDAQGHSLMFTSTFDEQFRSCNKVLHFLPSSPTQHNALDLPDFRRLQEFNTHRIFPASEFDAHQPLNHFLRQLIATSNISIHPDRQILFTHTPTTEFKDLLSMLAHFYFSNNSLTWRNHSILVPNHLRLNGGVGSHVYNPSVKLHATTIAPIKSPDTVKAKPSQKRRMSKKVGRERDLYKRNYFHACESLLSYMFNKQRHGKRAILSLKNCGRDLPELLTQLSAGIAGTGLVVILSVMCKVAWGRVPFCSSKLLNTGFGISLVWLSCAVNKLRDTIICISKKAGKVGSEDEMTRRVDKSVNEIFFRAATLMAVAILRIG